MVLLAVLVDGPQRLHLLDAAVEPVGRFAEDDQRGVAEQGRRDAEALPRRGGSRRCPRLAARSTLPSSAGMPAGSRASAEGRLDGEVRAPDRPG